MSILYIPKLAIAGLLWAAPAKDTTARKDSVPAAERTTLNIGVTFNSTLNFLGRSDSYKSRGIYPSIGISVRGGLYANASFVFVDNSQTRQYAATVLEAGYHFGSKKGDWDGNISATDYYYQQDIQLVQSVIRGTFAASLTQLNKIANITLEADARWSSQIDEGLQGGLDHTIRLPKIFSARDVLVIDPTATVYAGTQHFTQTFFTEKHFLFLPAGEQALTTNSQLFSLLACEASIPVVYAYRDLKVIFDPAYIQPMHVLDGNGQMTAMGSRLFYWTLTVKLNL
ncbi:MAG TPA: hypothetical protein VN616_17675 [Puia sp.]|nr:hypothetical protein [Puia sp.]